jgi:hypothetical protein
MKLDLKKRLIKLYTFFFIISFIIIFSLDFFYKKIISVTGEHTYFISAEQHFGFKDRSLENIFYSYFSNGKKISKKKLQKLFRIENKVIEVRSLTLNNIKSNISFDLITRTYIDENKFEEKINNMYLGPIKKIINDLENNRKLYSFELINQKYLEKNNNEVIKGYYKLINSSFFAKYPPSQSCDYNDVTICYEIFSKYYISLYYSLVDRQSTEALMNKLRINNLIPLEEGEEIIEILTDFRINRALYDSFNFDKTLSNFNQEFRYFSQKYNDLIKSDFFLKYMPTSYCYRYSKNCLRELEVYYDKILAEHKIESKSPFNIKYIKPENDEFIFLKELPLVFGMSVATTYLLFIFTNKFFRRKLK